MRIENMPDVSNSNKNRNGVWRRFRRVRNVTLISIFIVAIFFFIVVYTLLYFCLCSHTHTHIYLYIHTLNMFFLLLDCQDFLWYTRQLQSIKMIHHDFYCWHIFKSDEPVSFSFSQTLFFGIIQLFSSASQLYLRESLDGHPAQCTRPQNSIWIPEKTRETLMTPQQVIGRFRYYVWRQILYILNSSWFLLCDIYIFLNSL